MKPIRPFHILSFLSALLFISLQVYDPPVIRDHLESKTYDLRLRLRDLLVRQPDMPEIVIVAVDEKSVAEVGRWPWRREVTAELIERVAAGKPKAMGVDIMFTEPERPESDARLASALKCSGAVLATPFVMDEKECVVRRPEGADALWDSAFMEVRSVPGIPWKKWAVKPKGVNLPAGELASVCPLGHVTSLPDSDGVLRWEILAVQYGDDCYPSLPLQVARLARGIQPKEMVLFGGSGVSLGGTFVSTDLFNRVLVNYRSGESGFPYVSAADVLSRKVPSSTFMNRIVLVGTSALATYDQKVTPLSAGMPGVEKNANVVRNLLANDFIRKSPGVVELATLVVTTFILMLVLPRLRNRWGVTLSFALIGGYAVLSCLLLSHHGIWIGFVYPVSNMAAITTFETVMRLFLEERRAKEIRRMFSSYVSPKIVEALIADPEKATALGGERRVATILFSDMIGFTSLSEKLPPEEVVSVLNEYYREMAEIIFYWDGTLDKFVGDEIMAIWNAPTDQPDHVERALRCAFHMSDVLDRMRKRWREAGWHDIDCGIGINTGEVVIGNIGVQGKKMDYTAIGNHVNIAARVEKLNRQYGSRILITGKTYREIQPLLERGAIGHGEFTELEPVRVKGKEEEVRIFLVKSLPPDEDQTS